jgi:hypothetical protein
VNAGLATADLDESLFIMKSIHRKDAKNAKFLIVSNKEFLCVLCVFALKSVFMDGYLFFLNKILRVLCVFAVKMALMDTRRQDTNRGIATLSSTVRW